MPSEEQTHYRPRKNEIIVAIIGAVAVLATAIISNWDKISGDMLTAQIEGYRPTGKYEKELRYYFNNSGWREMIENTQKEFLKRLRSTLTAKYPREADTINAIMYSANQEALRVDDVIKALLPVYQKHYTIKELQELNKFYSTEVMQNWGNKIPLIAEDAAPIQAKLMLDLQKRLQERLNRTLPNDSQVVIPQVCLYGLSAPG